MTCQSPFCLIVRNTQSNLRKAGMWTKKVCLIFHNFIRIYEKERESDRKKRADRVKGLDESKRIEDENPAGGKT